MHERQEKVEDEMKELLKMKIYIVVNERHSIPLSFSISIDKTSRKKKQKKQEENRTFIQSRVRKE